MSKRTAALTVKKRLANALTFGLGAISLGLSSVPVLASDDTALFDLSLDELLATRFETASKYQETINESPAVSTVITGDEIARYGGNSLYEVLERVVGSYLTGSNFFPQNVLSLRGDLLGHYDNHVLMLLNGRPLRESYAGGVNFAIYTAMPLNMVERIEVIRGPGSALYGSNAYTGVVNIITKQLTSAHVSATVGSLATKAGELWGGVAGDDWAVNYGLKRFYEQGWQFTAKDNNSVEQSIDFGENALGAFVEGHYQQWHVNALYVANTQDFMGASADWSGQPPIDERTMASTRAVVDVGYQQKVSEQWQWQANWTWSDMDFDHYNYVGKSTDQQFELSSHYRPNKQWNWVVGATAWHQDVGSEAERAAAPVPDFTATWYSLYSQLDYKPFTDLKLLAGLQWNKAENLSADVVSRLGATYQLSEHSGAKLMHAQAYRAAFGVETGFSLILTNPDGSVRGGLRGNPLLEPERVTTDDLQWFYHDTHLQFSATLFRSKLTDLITRERAADNVIDFVNKGEMTLRGYELEAKYNINEQWHLTVNHSYQTNETDAGIENYTTVPNRMTKAGFIYQSQQGISLGVYSNWLGAATDIAVQNPARNAYNPDADSYQLWTVQLLADLGKWRASLQGLKVAVYGYNVTDALVYQPDFIGKRVNTLPARAGRTGYLTVSYDF